MSEMKDYALHLLMSDNEKRMYDETRKSLGMTSHGFLRMVVTSYLENIYGKPSNR